MWKLIQFLSKSTRTWRQIRGIHHTYVLLSETNVKRRYLHSLVSTYRQRKFYKIQRRSTTNIISDQIGNHIQSDKLTLIHYFLP